jgi:hypothetical protein
MCKHSFFSQTDSYYQKTLNVHSPQLSHASSKTATAMTESAYRNDKGTTTFISAMNLRNRSFIMKADHTKAMYASTCPHGNINVNLMKM